MCQGRLEAADSQPLCSGLLRALLARSRFTKPDSRVCLTRAFFDLHGGHIEVQGPFNPYIPCSLAAQQPREYLIREPLVVDAPLACVWCATASHFPACICDSLLMSVSVVQSRTL